MLLKSAVSVRVFNSAVLIGDTEIKGPQRGRWGAGIKGVGGGGGQGSEDHSHGIREKRHAKSGIKCRFGNVERRLRLIMFNQCQTKRRKLIFEPAKIKIIRYQWVKIVIVM